MKGWKKALSCLLTCLLLGEWAPAFAADKSAEEERTVRKRIGFSTTYPESYGDWAEGFMTGNGTMGAIVFGDPLHETLVVNHRRFFIASTGDRRFNKVSEELLTRIRKACAAGDFKTANDLANAAHGWQDGGEGNKHPGYAIKLDVTSSGTVRQYQRSCDYRTGEIKVNWQDDNGLWERTAFTSRADNVLVQRLTPPTEGELAVTVSLGTEEGMHFPSGMKFEYKAEQQYLTVHATYPNPSATGRAGYEGVTRVIVKGRGAKVRVRGNQISISGAAEILLLTRAEKYYADCEEEWGKEAVKAALAELPEDYDALMAGQLATHTAIYDRVTLDLGADEADRELENGMLLAMQHNSGKMLPALYERLFDAGRYHMLCSSGDVGAPDLLGLWTGDCNVGWSGYYHLDANLNLQISGAVIGNMTETLNGYEYLMDKWADGFRKNAADLLGCRGMLGGGNTPGETSGLISALNYYYPYQYVTGEMAWLLYPYWEYWQATGDETFLRDTLYPYLAEMGLFYEDFLKEKDGDGNYIFAGSISPENQPAGLGLSLVNNSAFDVSGCRWLLERLIQVCEKFHFEMGEGEGVSRWSEILRHLPPYRINEDDGALAEWAWDGLKDNYNHRHSSGLMGVWPYREITPERDGALFEAACITLAKKDQYNYENAGHGLLHAALIAANLKNAESVENKLLRFGREGFYYSGLTTAHYVNHGVFCTDVANTLPTVMMEMLISSDEDGIEPLPALPKSLPKGSIEGMLTRCGVTLNDMSWDMEANTVSLTLTSNTPQTVTITQRQGIQAVRSDVPISNWQQGDVRLQATLPEKETVRLDLKLVKKVEPRSLIDGATVTASSFENRSPDRAPENCIDGNGSTRWASATGESAWLQIDLGQIFTIEQIKLQWEAAYAEAYELYGSTDGEEWTPVYVESAGKGGTELRQLTCDARYLKFQFTRRTTVNGVKYGYSLYEVDVFGHEREILTLGDVDGDGAVTSTDARLTLQRSVGKIRETELAIPQAADVDGDGRITSTDARMILQYSVGKITDFSA